MREPREDRIDRRHRLAIHGPQRREAPRGIEEGDGRAFLATFAGLGAMDVRRLALVEHGLDGGGDGGQRLLDDGLGWLGRSVRPRRIRPGGIGLAR